MAARTVELTPLARTDLEGIWLYSAQQWSRAQADNYVAAIIQAFERLATGGSSGRPLEVKPEYHSIHVGSHAIFYRLQPGTLVVVRVLHQSMDVSRHL